MRRRDVLLETDGTAAGCAGSAPPRRRPGRRHLLALMVGVTTMVAAGCGEDANDAPGGSAPATGNPEATSPPSAPGPGSPGSGPSPEAADEAHPSVPVADEGD